MKPFFILLASLTVCACGSVPTSNESSDSTSLEMEDRPFVSTDGYTLDQPRHTLSDIRVSEVHQTPQGLIDILARGFSWNLHLERAEVKKHIRHYQSKPEQLETILSRSTAFLPLISKQLKNRNLPTELAFLPLVESGYQADIYSRAGAAGLWQLMPRTARHLGMEISWWYDERLDIQSSTKHALDYLEYLNKQFRGNWELTIAAYNGGEGHVRAQMRRAKSKNFWDLSLKRETENYLPRLLAVAEILSHPGKYNVEIPMINPESPLNELMIDQQVDLRLLATKVGMEYSEFKLLNPNYQRWISPPQGQYPLLLPKEKADLLEGRLSELQPDQLESWDHYRVKSGDTLIDIARKFGTTVRSLIAVNELPNSRIYARQELLIPKLEERKIASSRPDTVKELYIVKPGDSLWEIARQNGLSVTSLKKRNDIGRKGIIRPGQVLILNEFFTGKELTYEVKRGDSLSEIAHQFDVAIADLKVWNSLGSNDLIHPGQLLKIRKQQI